MKKVPLSEVKDDLSRYLRLAEAEEIVITRHGKPAGVLIGFESEDDWFEYRLQNDPKFGRELRTSRQLVPVRVLRGRLHAEALGHRLCSLGRLRKARVGPQQEAEVVREAPAFPDVSAGTLSGGQIARRKRERVVREESKTAHRTGKRYRLRAAVVRVL